MAGERPQDDRYRRIYAAVAAIPRGSVASYGGVAKRAGLPRGARMVGRALADCAPGLPWHRVVNAAGRLSLPPSSTAYREQVRRLEREGVKVRNGKVARVFFEREATGLDELLWGPAACEIGQDSPRDGNVAMNARHVCFSHGRESGPWGTKIRTLAELAQSEGWSVASLDYQGLEDPVDRVAKLAEYCDAYPGRIALAGSSMGGFVVATVAASRPVRGAFLMAPAFYVPGYEQYVPPPATCPVTIVHGWRDDVVPWEGSLQYASRARARLALIDGDHRLTASLGEVRALFRLFLQEIDQDQGEDKP